MKKYKPAYLIHGHTQGGADKKTAMSHYLSTRIINTNHYRILEIENGPVR
jgi:hypothetical protein